MKVIFLVVLFFLAVSASKISEQLAKEISKSSEIDFVINLKNVQYRSLKHKGKSFESLDIETKAHFIVDSLINHAAVSQKNIESLLKEKNVEYSKLWIINSISVKKGSVSLINELSVRSDVESLTFDEKYTIADSNTKEISQEEVRRQRIEWNLVWVKADQLWKKGFTGKGKVVGLVDTGVNFRHPGVASQYLGNKNGTYDHDYAWFGPGDEPRDTQDHGTHCTGSAVGSTADKSYVIGASHDSKWIHCHFGGSFTVIAKCFQFMLAPTDRKGNNPKPELRPHVTSHSYGGGGQGRSQLENVVQPCLDAGVHVVVAAHNYARCRSVTDPGIIPTVLTCGALGDRTDNIASFSSKGPGPAAYNNTLKPEISAPGTNIISALGGSMNYGSKSGTSMSTPLIAGSIALLWDAVPALNRNIKRTNEVLYQTANHQRTRDCESPKDTPNNVYGYGTINVLKAYELATKLYGNK